jgi:hypothetical protein
LKTPAGNISCIFRTNKIPNNKKVQECPRNTEIKKRKRRQLGQ